MLRRSFLPALSLAAAGLFTAGGVYAQAYPAKPIRLVVPFAPGGTTDIVARSVAEPLARALGQPVVVENRAGEGGMTGAVQVATAAADGYTLGLATVSTVASIPAINPKTPYDPLKDFTPIVAIAATPNILSVNAKTGIKNHEAFVAAAKATPAKFAYASTGTGSITHLMMEGYRSLTHLDVMHIPYRGAGPALKDVSEGLVPVMFDNLPSTLPLVKSGKLAPLAVAAPQRLAALPEVPTFKELGLEPVNRMAFYGIVGPKGLPRTVVDKVNAAVLQVLKDPAVRRRIEGADSIVLGNTPEQFAKEIRDELAAYRRIVAEQKLTLY